MEATKLYLTNKQVALDWLNRDYVLCNNIPEIDLDLFDDVRYSTLGEDDEFVPTKCPACGSTNIRRRLHEDGTEDEYEWECLECCDEKRDDYCGNVWDPDDEKHPDDEELEREKEEELEEKRQNQEFYQYFLTNMSEDDVDYMCKHFSDFVFAYSPKLDLWVWCATDIGTHRSYVMIETDLKYAERKEGEEK